MRDAYGARHAPETAAYGRSFAPTARMRRRGGKWMTDSQLSKHCNFMPKKSQSTILFRGGLKPTEALATLANAVKISISQLENPLASCKRARTFSP